MYFHLPVLFILIHIVFWVLDLEFLVVAETPKYVYAGDIFHNHIHLFHVVILKKQKSS